MAAKIVVWEHNSHIGDARATESGRHGECTLGQLVRERYGGDCFLVGMTTYTGTVTAASRWDGKPERKRVRPALADSYEWLFHHSGAPRFLLPLGANSAAARAFQTQQLLERAIGVLYKPATERQSHYFQANIAHQFDALIHIDETKAVVPLDAGISWHGGEAPETYPVGV
jgi:erythromycin esterase-like protein